jgi:hypothetical protein
MCFEGLRKTRKTSVMIAVFCDENQEKNSVSVRETHKNGNKDFVSFQIVMNSKMKFLNNFEVDFPGSSQDI